VLRKPIHRGASAYSLERTAFERSICPYAGLVQHGRMRVALTCTNENCSIREPSTRTKYGYDDAGRLLSKTPDASFNAQPVTFTYYPNGQRKTMTDATGTTSYVFSSVQGSSRPPRESYWRSYCLFL